MEEQAIQAKLAQNLPKSTPHTADMPTDDSVEPADILDPLTNLKLLDYFQLGTSRRGSPETQTMLETIYRWAIKSTGTTEYLPLVDHIRYIEGQLGTSLHPERMEKLHQFIRLQEQSQAIDREMGELING
jgi:hypothetical protein